MWQKLYPAAVGWRSRNFLPKQCDSALRKKYGKKARANQHDDDRRGDRAQIVLFHPCAFALVYSGIVSSAGRASLLLKFVIKVSSAE